MARAFGLVLLLIALYVAFQLHVKGTEQAFGGLFAPLESVNQRDEPLATSLTPLAQDADLPHAAPTRRVPITDALRERAQSHVDEGARRSRRY